MSTPTNRKPSGSSTHSSGRSSPAQAQAHRKLTPAAHLFGAGAPGLKALNPGWQVWANAAPTSRNVSASSSTNMPEPSQIESAMLASLTEPWHGSRTTTNNWQDVSANMPRESHSSVPLHVRQRQASGQSSVTLPMGDHSPQRFDATTMKDPSIPSRFSTASPSKLNLLSAGAPLPIHNPNVHTSGTPYDPVQSAAVVDNDLAVALRGMAVEDEYGLSQHAPHRPVAHALEQPHPTALPTRGPHQAQQQRASFAAFPRPDYPAYYNAPPSRIDYPYPFDAYRGPDPMYASPVPSTVNPAQPGYPGMPPQGLAALPLSDPRRQQSALYYDYPGSNRPGQQFYYPPQALMYPPPTPQQMGGGPGPNKKREMQFATQQVPQMLAYHNIRTSPSLNPPGFPSPDFAAHMPMLVPGQPMYMHGGAGASPHMHHMGRLRRHDDPHAMRSPLLDEFRNDKVRKWELKDLYGHIVEFSTDQHGSRFIQQKLEVATDEEQQAIFDEIAPQHALRLIQDVFGNYVIQKFLERGTSTQKAILTKCMEGHILPLALQMYGCRVVQKVVEHLGPEEQSWIVNELEDNVLRCVKDANGNHVIQRLIERVEPDRLTFVRRFRGHVHELATHPYGCRVLQRCFEHLPAEHTRGLLDELQRHSLQLMQDQFGNYVVQFVLEHGQEQDRALIIPRLRGRILHMSRHKFASNVVEKALIMADSSTRRSMIDEMMAVRKDGSSPVHSMMKDQFANYVLQKALAVADNDQRAALIEKIKPHLVMRRSTAHSRHLIAIERLLAKCSTVGTEDPATLEGHATDVSFTSSQ